MPSDAPESVVTQLVLIRHGASVASATHTLGGPRTCAGLTDEGREQCARLAARLTRTAELAGCVLYASHYRRAQETAAAIGSALDGPDLLIDEGFGEIDPGPECDGLGWTEFLERYGPVDWDADPDAVVFPGGETVAELHRRVAGAIEAAVKEHSGRLIAVCTHGGVVDAAVRFAMGIRERGGFDLFTTNTSLTAISTSAGWDRWRIDRYNDAAHLL